MFDLLIYGLAILFEGGDVDEELTSGDVVDGCDDMIIQNEFYELILMHIMTKVCRMPSKLGACLRSSCLILLWE